MLSPDRMADFLVVVTVVVFFALCVALRVRVRPHHRIGRRRVTGENIAGLVLAVLLCVYLVAALLFPERF